MVLVLLEYSEWDITKLLLNKCQCSSIIHAICRLTHDSIRQYGKAHSSLIEDGSRFEESLTNTRRPSFKIKTKKGRASRSPCPGTVEKLRETERETGRETGRV